MMDGSDHDRKYYRKPWMTDGQWECAKLVAEVVGGFHHVPGGIKECHTGIAVSLYAHTLATFDNDRLTRLVLLAHDRCVRIELAASSPSRVRLLLHSRGGRREGMMHERHPTAEQALAAHRKYYPEVA